MFRESSEKEQELYQAVARAGTLLLQIGDASCQENQEYVSSSVEWPVNEPRDSKAVQRNSSDKLLNTSGSVKSSGETSLTKNALSSGETEKAGGSDTSASDNVTPEELELNVAVRGMTLAEALADAQRSLSSSPGHTESVKSEDYVYVDDSQGSEPRISPEASQANLGSAELEAVGSSYKEVASCLEESSEIPHPYIGTESASIKCAADSENAAETELKYEVKPSSDRIPSNVTAQKNWIICFRQFVACVLSEPCLVEFFEQPYNLDEALGKAVAEGMRRSISTGDDSLLEQKA